MSKNRVINIILKAHIERHAQRQRRLHSTPAATPYRDVINRTYLYREFSSQLEMRWAIFFDLIDWQRDYNNPCHVSNWHCQCRKHKLTVIVKPTGFRDGDAPSDPTVAWFGRNPQETVWTECSGRASLRSHFDDAELSDLWAESEIIVLTHINPPLPPIAKSLQKIKAWILGMRGEGKIL
jgi:hypothetical protein